MRIVGITGRSGCGKSTVTAWLAGQGCRCLEVDAVARRLLTAGDPDCPALLLRLQQRFGADIVDTSGALRRHLLADRAFATPAGTRELNAITHPAILRRVRQITDAAAAAGERLFFLDAAVLVGTIFADFCDELVLVTAPYEASVQRICARDGLSVEAARRRLDAQTPEAVLRAAARHILENDGTVAELQAKAAALLERLRAETP